jgi:tetratricopeptide (TPR) repeat protein
MNAIEEIEKLAKLRDRGVLTEEEFQELKVYTLSSEDNQLPTIDKSIANNIKPKPEPIIPTYSVEPEPKDIRQPFDEPKPTESTKIDTNNINPYANTVAIEQKPQTPAPSGNKWLIGIAGLMVIAACIGLGYWFAHNGAEKANAELKAEAAQKQATIDEEIAKKDAELKRTADAIIANSRKREPQSSSETNATPPPEPVSEQQEAQAPQPAEKAPTPATETANAPKEESPPAKSSADLIQYDSPATPFVIQMVDTARDTEKLFAAKNSLTELGKPVKGDRKAARKLNDTAIALMGEKKYTEAIPILQEAHKTDPADIEIMNNLAYANIEKGITDNNFTQAKTALVDTLRLKPERAQAWANLGRTFALEGIETAATNCYINFFRFAENKEKALSRLQSGINETNPILGKALTNAYNYVKTNIEPTSNSEAGGGE